MKGFLQHSLCTLFLKQQPDEAPTIAQTNSDPPEGVPERATGRRGVWGESRLPGCPLLPHGLTIPSSLQTEVSFTLLSAVLLASATFSRRIRAPRRAKSATR